VCRQTFLLLRRNVDAIDRECDPMGLRLWKTDTGFLPVFFSEGHHFYSVFRKGHTFPTDSHIVKAELVDGDEPRLHLTVESQVFRPTEDGTIPEIFPHFTLVYNRHLGVADPRESSQSSSSPPE
jgi:hypothetical protein